MRPNVAISGLLACSVGVSAAGTIERLVLHDNEGTKIPSPNSVITVKQTLPDISLQPVILRTGLTMFLFETNGAEINTVRLKMYNDTGPSNGDDDEVFAVTLFNSSGSISGTDGEVMLNSDRGEGTGPSLTSLLNRKFLSGIIKLGTYVNESTQAMPNNSLGISWINSNQSIANIPLYLECEWTRLASSGNSTTQLFAVYDGVESSKAEDSLDEARDSSDIEAPARQEISTVIPTSPTPSTKPETSTSPTSGTTAATVGPESSTPTPNGLGTNAIIGIAVGVGGGGLLIAAALIWFFCFRRRRRTAAQHAMPSYASDVGVHAMMQDKEIPVVLESSSPPYGSGGADNEGRPSTDHYAPYSDRSTTSPTPDHHRTASGTTAAVATIDATSQTRGAPSPTPAIVSRYAHLVEEGMTEDEIRRLEEEERQLDAAIENAGRGGNSRAA
ncbi:hypothetical protein FHL15_000907 [Xylaria flabelliformis]|uniref:Mid2 domain-containing protein n=1 Tax=Xylaria flabelliformis TaxID=2512241 RepID=A0A553IDH5_9PEZI|nr:hypothetical protein FHL15_000907 [Xylaria flabelliformis]